MVSLNQNNNKSLSIKFLVWLAVILFLAIVLVGGLYFFKTGKVPWQGFLTVPQIEKTSSGLIVGGEYGVLESIDVYVSSDDAVPAGYIIPGKSFLVLKQEGEMIYIEMVGVVNAPASNWWVKISESSYKLADKE